MGAHTCATETTTQKQPALTPARLKARIVAFALIAAVTFLAVFVLGSLSPAPTPPPQLPAIFTRHVNHTQPARPAPSAKLPDLLNSGGVLSRPVAKQQQQQQQQQKQQEAVQKLTNPLGAKPPGLNDGSAAASRPAAKQQQQKQKLPGLKNESRPSVARHNPKGIISGAPPGIISGT